MQSCSCQRASPFCFGADARKQHGAGNAYHATRFVRPQLVGNLWNAESLKWFWKQKGFFFFLISEKTGAAASYSQPVNLSVVRSDLWEEAFRCCVTESLLMPTLGVRSQKCSNSRENVVYLVFFFFVLWAIATTTPTAEIRGRGDIVTMKSRQAKKHNQMTNHLFYSGERNEKIRRNARNITQAVQRVLQSKRTDLFYENFFLIQQPPESSGWHHSSAPSKSLYTARWLFRDLRLLKVEQLR